MKSCRACHLQAGDDSAPMPAIQYPDKPAPTKLNNEVAYHLNCNICHDKAIAATARFERQSCPAQTTASPATSQQAKTKKN